MTNTTPALASNTYKQQIVTITSESTEWGTLTAEVNAITASIPRVIYFTQAGSGSANGLTLADSYPVSQFSTYVATPGDLLIFSGTITSSILITYIHSGTSSNPVRIVGIGGTDAYLNPGSSIVAIQINPITKHVHISDFRIGTCSIGIWGFAHWDALSDIHVDRVVVESPTARGISFETAATSAAVPYAVCHDIVVTDCKVLTAGQHGIQMGVYSDGTCGVRRCKVLQAATSGDYWGIYAQSIVRTANVTWSGSNPYTATMVQLGWGSNAPYQVIEQLMIQDYTTSNTANKVHFNKGTWGALNNWEFAQNGRGGDIQIKLPSPDAGINGRLVFTSPFSPSVMSGFFDRCEAHNVSSNGGSTDGHGIGTDYLCSNWDIIHCDSHDNEGANFIIDSSGGCRLISCVSWRAGTYGFLVHDGGRDKNRILDCRSFGDPNGARITRTETDNVECIGLYVVKSASDITLESTSSIVAANLGNVSKACTSNNSTYVIAL